MQAQAPAAHWRYGLIAVPLAFAALPLYVALPAYYAREFGVPLAALGALLLVARLLDAFTDPLLGRWIDRLFTRSPRDVIALAAVAAFALASGFTLLFLPPVRGAGALLAWAALCLVITYFGYSTLSVLHQAWGAMLGGDESLRGSIAGWREGLGLAGVLVAAVLPSAAGWPVACIALATLCALGVAALASSSRPQPAAAERHAGAWEMPFRQARFRRLVAVFMLNGIATAVPATLLLFFVRDRLQAPAGAEPLYLAAYFLCGALSVPLWLRAVPRFGLARCWRAGMVLSIAVFAWASLLGPGQWQAFFAICALSGLALGADLPLPGALLSGVIAHAGHRGSHDGLYVGWWNFATKLNLALAAGVALPLLSLAGYAPGTRGPDALLALTIAYCAIPCALKLAAAWLLSLEISRHGGFR